MKAVRVFECETTGCTDSRGVVAKQWLRKWLRVWAVIISVDRGGLRRGFRSRDRQSSEGGREQLSRNVATSSTRASCIVTRVFQWTDDDVIYRYAADGSWYGSRYHYSSSYSSTARLQSSFAAHAGHLGTFKQIQRVELFQTTTNTYI